ncbi:MFS transporter [Virgibacillus siamensis]|uniref:MFS transporter n=1 Tax=Virgibacillus siamensis TaxID=480071 RepID=UPI0011156554|nr:MFS transporter [Virgibacillus siamensis]
MKQISVGIIPAPELPEAIANKLALKLETAFSMQIDNNISWNVEVVLDQLTGASGRSDEIIKRALALKAEHNWEYAICLTDMPIFSDKTVVLAEGDDGKGVAQISIPAFGAFPLKTRVKKAIIQMVGELYFRINGHGTYVNSDIVERNNKQLMKSERKFSPVKKVLPDNEDADLRFIVRPRIHGLFRLIAGMTYANRPWRIIPAFKRVVAVAFATGAYGLVFTTLWNISAAYGGLQFTLLTLIAIAGMVIWIIFAHNLWEKHNAKTSRKLTMLYNMVTVVTLTSSVIVYYAVLYILFLFAVVFFVPPDLFVHTVGIKDNNIHEHFIQLAWLVTSVAVIAGAMGSGLENDKTVRKIMYGHRQWQRYKEMEHNDDFLKE